MKKILITGGNGFIARNIYKKLNSEYKLISLNSKELNLLDDSRVFDRIKRDKFDLIIHTATYDAAPKHSIKDPSMVLENNLKMFFNIVRCNNYFDRMIYFGSGAEFDREHWIPKMKEDYFDRHIPKDQYGFSKYIMTKYALANENIYNLRLFAVFGKNDDWRTRFIPNACSKAVLNEDIIIHKNAFYDHIYIDDLVKIVDWFIKNKPKKSVYNVCSGETYSRKELAEKIIKFSGKNLKIIIESEELGREYSGDNNLLLKEIKDFKFSSFDESIKNIYNWYDKNKHLIEKG